MTPSENQAYLEAKIIAQTVLAWRRIRFAAPWNVINLEESYRDIPGDSYVGASSKRESQIRIRKFHRIPEIYIPGFDPSIEAADHRFTEEVAAVTAAV